MRTIVAGLVLAAATVVYGASVNVQGAGGRGATTAAATEPEAQTMVFHFEDTAVEDILREVTAKFGIAVEKDGIVPGRVTILVPEALNEQQAVSLLDTILLSVHYAAVERQREGDPRRVLRVMPFDLAKKEAPIRAAE
jgi:hypothetical protein